jgi:hypothetical protein
MTFNAQRDQKAKYFEPVVSDEPMTAHQLAQALLKMPDRRVEMDTASDWGPHRRDEGLRARRYRGHRLRRRR